VLALTSFLVFCISSVVMATVLPFFFAELSLAEPLPISFVGACANSLARETQQLSSGNSFAQTVAKYSSSEIFITGSGNDLKHFIPNTYFIYE
nr:hypothetical protein [Tanacetum cinerariifolium]